MPGFLWVDGSLLSAWLWHGHLRVRLWIAWVRLGSLLHSFNASALCATAAAAEATRIFLHTSSHQLQLHHNGRLPIEAIGVM